jgi:hypothetical protein
MTQRQILYAALLLPFLALTTYVLESAGFAGFYRAVFASPSTVLAGVDLTLSLGLILAWMASDARTTRTPWLPYAAVTLALGVAGPLLYLIHREARVRSRTPAVQRA